MLPAFLAIPLEARCLLVFLLGLGLGSLVNWGIYALAWNARAISPWSKRPEKAPPRKWWDRLPVIGWFGLRRERALWGRGFWVRPPIMEVVTAGGLALLYYWEVNGDLLPAKPWALPAGLTLEAITHARFFSHGLLILLMLVATFIDFDEQSIPDEITVTGALVGLLIAAIWPYSLPTNLDFAPFPLPPILDFLWLTAPNPWTAALDGPLGLLLGLGCFLFWCFGILDKRWKKGLAKKHGWPKAWRLFRGSIARGGNWPLVLGLAILGSLLLAIAWFVGGTTWPGLLSSLVGLASGMALLWAIRIIGVRALNQEAMGFGDVTLMAMIGAFVGWQGAMIAFFVAPFAALVIALTQYAIVRRHDIAFGPYLCGGALYVLLRWAEAWEPPFAIRGHFAMGLLIPSTILICLGLMWVLLIAVRWLREKLFGPVREIRMSFRTFSPRWLPTPLWQIATDLERDAELLRSRRYGVIEIVDGELSRIVLRPWPKLVIVSGLSLAGDRCWLYYNQPRGSSNFLTLKYTASSRRATFATCRRAAQVLDEIARIKRSDAIVCEAHNLRISERLLARWGWQRHVLTSPRRHYIKRFYGEYATGILPVPK